MDNRLIRVINIRDIVLVNMRVSTSWKPETLPLDRPLFRLHYSADATDLLEESQVEVLATLSVEEDVDEGQEPSLIVEAAFRLTYDRPPDCKPSQQELKHFAENNGIFNAWPYWRELSHSMFRRMGLPLPPIPVFRVSSGIHGSAATPSLAGSMD